MTKRILLIFCLLTAMIVPATAATRAKARHHKHAVARSRKAKGKSKSIRKSTHHRSKSRRAKR
jgi:hypothetical protein